MRYVSARLDAKIDRLFHLSCRSQTGSCYSLVSPNLKKKILNTCNISEETIIPTRQREGQLLYRSIRQSMVVPFHWIKAEKKRKKDFTRIDFGIQVFRNVKLRRLVSASRCFEVSRRLYLQGLISPSFENLGPTYQNLAHQRESLLLRRRSAWETKLQTTSNKNAINPIIIIKQSQYKTSGDQWWTLQNLRYVSAH